MKWLLVAAITLIGSSVCAQPFQLVTHNGSLMRVTPLPYRQVEITYADPKPELWPVGVVPGTVLLRSQWIGRTLNATAFVFPGWCGPVPYAVSGSVNRDGVLTLVGPAPMVTPWCFVIGVTWASANATLVFVPYR
jgi:hypothetical protein